MMTKKKYKTFYWWLKDVNDRYPDRCYPSDHQITIEEAIHEHKLAFGRWPFFDDPRRVWHDKNGYLCMEFVRKIDLALEWYHYGIEHNHIVWW